MTCVEEISQEKWVVLTQAFAHFGHQLSDLNPITQYTTKATACFLLMFCFGDVQIK